MKSMVSKYIEQGTSKDGKTVRIEYQKIKQSAGPLILKQLKEMGTVRSLVIKGCRLKVLPNEIEQLSHLRRLHIEDNKLSEIPSLERLENLEELVLSSNQVSRFQVSISKLSQLRSLDLSYNLLGTIPVRLFMGSLKELSLDSNQFSNFPAQLCELVQLESLSFADNQLKQIPSTIGQLKSLCKLVFAGNALEQIPPEITTLQSLTYLDVSSNNIKQIPQSIGKLKLLRNLHVQHNKLRVLPEDIGHCTAITTLRLNNNTLSHLPASIGKLINLSELYVQENRLVTLPTEIGECKALRKLNLEFNKIAILPAQLRQLSNLNLLSLHDNALEELPSFLQVDFLQHLVRLSIHNNVCYDQILATSTSTESDPINQLIQHLTPSTSSSSQHVNGVISTTPSVGVNPNAWLSAIDEGDDMADNLSSSNGSSLNVALKESNNNNSSGGSNNSISSYNNNLINSLINPIQNGSPTPSSPFAKSPASSSPFLSSMISGASKKKGSDTSLSKVAMHNNGMQAGRLADFSSDSEDGDSDSDTNSTSSSNFFNQPTSPTTSNIIGIQNVLSTSSSASSLNSMLSSHLHNTLKRSSISPRSSLIIQTSNSNGGSLSEMFSNQSKLMDGQITPNGSSSPTSSRVRKGSGSNLYESGFGGNSLSNSSSGVGTPPINSNENHKVPALSRSSSSFLNMLTLRRKSLSVSGSSPLVPSTSPLSQSSSSSPTPHTPTFKSFQSIFESLLDDLDYSKKRREELNNLPTEDKWTFLQKLKPDCVNSLLANGILTQPQQSTTELKSLLSSPPKLTVSQTLSPKSLPPPTLTRIPKSPRGYSKVLSNHSLFSYEDISKLRQQLIEKPVTWVVNFAESSGIVAILSMISSFSLKEPKVDEDYLVINECLSCLKLLIELEMQSILLCDMTDIILPHIKSSSLSVKKLALEVLDVLCRTFTIGSVITLESIKSYSKKNQVSLGTPLGFIHSPLDGEYTLDVKVNCMSLINQLIKGCKELSTRVDIRNEFLSIGIQKSIKNLRIDGEGIETSSWKLLEREMQVFERMMVEDDNYIVPSLSPRLDCSVGGDSGLSLPNSPGANGLTGADPFDPIFDSRLVVKIACNPSSMANNNELATPTMVTGGSSSGLVNSTTSAGSDDNPLSASSSAATATSTNVTMREVLVPISKKSQAGDVIRAIISSNSNLREFGEWGLFVCDGDSKTQLLDGRFLRDDEFILEQNSSQPNGSNAPLRSLILFKQYTLKMVPWKVRLSLEKVKDMDTSLSNNNNNKNYVIEEPMDPTTTCAGLVDHILKKHLPSIGRYCLESDDFGLYLDSAGFGTGGYWLEPLEKLHDYEIFKDPKLTVQLKLRQKLVKLKFADGTYEQLRLDLTSPTEKIFAEISEKVMDPSNMHNLHYYGIFIDRQDTINQDHLLSSSTSSNNNNKNLMNASGRSFNKKPTVEWIEPGVPLYHYRIHSRVCLRYAVRPSQITLNIDCSLFQQLKEQQLLKEQKEQQQKDSDEDSNNNIPKTTIMDGDDADDERDSSDSDEPIRENLENKLKSVLSIEDPAQDSPVLTSTADVASLMAIPAPVKPKQIVVQIPLHLPLNESLETEDNWLDCNVDQNKCRFHIDSFDGPIVNRHQPLNSQSFTSKNCLYVVLADEVELQNSEFQNHVNTNIWEEANDRTTIIYDEPPAHAPPASSRDTSISTTTTTATITSTIPPTAQSQIIRAATLNKLVELSTNNIDVDRESMNILLMTYQSFTTSDVLLDKLIERYNVPEGEERQKKVIQLHVIVFVKNWLEQQSPQAASGGGLEERFLERINTFIDRLNQDGYTNMVPQLKKLYDAAIKGKRAYAMPEVHRSNLTTKIPSLANSFLDDELFIAQQLTVREYETFKRIQIVEFLNQAWNKPKLQYKAPNLLKMIDRFNKVSMAVSTAILHQAKLKPRIKLICRFIKIAQHLRELNNFHLLTAFLAGIRNSSVLRLRISWSKVPKKHKQTLEDLEKIMSMEGSFKAFRTIIKDIVPPCIPYLGVYLKDLTFIEDGNADSIEGLINWGKKKLMHNIISIIQKCQQIPYDYPLCTQQLQQKSEMVLATFDSLPIADDEVLYQVSQQLEPKAIQ